MSVKIPKITMVDIDKLVADEENPNQMTDHQIVSLKKSITKYGFLVALITNMHLVIADGHQRLTAVKAINEDLIEAGEEPITQLPCVVMDVVEVDRLMIQQVMNKLKGVHIPQMDMSRFKRIHDSLRLSELGQLITINEDKIKEMLKPPDVPESESLFKVKGTEYEEVPYEMMGYREPPNIVGSQEINQRHALTFIFDVLDHRNAIRDHFQVGTTTVPDGESLWRHVFDEDN